MYDKKKYSHQSIEKCHFKANLIKIGENVNLNSGKMSALNHSTEDVAECPLCMEPLEVDDLNFYPCTCGYQICRFCWHRIRTDENELCPACRKAYPENPADFTPLTQEEMIAFKSQKRQRDQQRRQKITENRKHLANVRVVQKNLVFVVGLPPRLADADILKKHEYFGKYGKIHKVVINPSTTYAGVQGPSASAYVTYVHNSDALRAIQSVNNIMIDGRLIKTSLGTTKYCSHFMKNQQCPKSDCMYLHELGDSEASFTKEEMHQGKHQEYEKRLHDTLIATSGFNGTSVNQTHSNNSSVNVVNSTSQTNNFFKNGDTKTINNTSPTSGMLIASSSAAATSSLSSGTTNSASGMVVNITGGIQQKEAWPSLSISPVNKDLGSSGPAINNCKTKKDKTKFEKSKNEKFKTKNSKNNPNSNKQNNGITNETNTNVPNESKEKNTTPELDIATTNYENSGELNKVQTEKIKEKGHCEKSNSSNRIGKDSNITQQKSKHVVSADSEIKLIENEKKIIDNKCDKNLAISKRNKENVSVSDEQRSSSSSSNMSSESSNNSDIASTQIGVSSRKSSPANILDSNCFGISKELLNESESNTVQKSIDIKNPTLKASNINKTYENQLPIENQINEGDTGLIQHTNTDGIGSKSPSFLSADKEQLCKKTVAETTASLSKLDMFDDTNSFFSSPGPSFQQSLLLRNKVTNDIRQHNHGTSQLPDLLNGIDGFSNKPINSSEWEEAFKNIMARNGKIDDQLQHQLQQREHFPQAQYQQDDELFRMHEFHKKNMFNNGVRGPNNEFTNSSNFTGNIDPGRTTQPKYLPSQSALSQSDHPSEQSSNALFGNTNMSKFFDFHKNQQQIHQQFGINANGLGTLNEQLRIASLIENNRINSQFLDQTPNSLMLHQQQQLQKQRLNSKYDALQSQQSSGQSQQTPQNCLSIQFPPNNSVDDDLGFDPFIETQKGLAELMENELQQNTCAVGRSTTPSVTSKMAHQQQISQQYFDNMQRARMPPPGFNHMNAFGFGMTRPQNANKMSPYMPGGLTTPSNNQPPQNQQQLQVGNSWNPRMASYPQQSLNDHRVHQISQNQNHNNVPYSNNDWTAMDPAILSFRQFSSYPQQQQQQASHHQHQDVYMQQLTNQQHNHQNFGNQPQLLGGMNMPNPLLNPSSSQTQVNANVQGMLEYLKNRQFM
ncbi:putative mediator of RNA polymerase II transcription subunit 26 isoform X2 [Teleopsis dalmanni]|uniref:putative mediator of RNA polymerase II transcription subunit 26 isoform X2 n=1 Tax=Teleopsis dalmanni TaxID=139649 RepID=UPI0018CFBCD8|nr:putative mediator of RNA polymerase II transcription subunit 26 isoform X2 [Teleopsis dalmanni]